jgi:hypothetical protein
LHNVWENVGILNFEYHIFYQSQAHNLRMSDPWYMDDLGKVNLPYMMISCGGKFCPPDEAINSKTGHPYLAPIVVMQPAENPKDFKLWHVLHSLRDSYYCTICKAVQGGNRQNGNHWNALTHVREKHIDQFPINCWTSAEAKGLGNKWLEELARVKSSKTHQLTITQSLNFVTTLEAQIGLWTRAAIIG